MMKIIGFTDYGIRMWPQSIRVALLFEKVMPDDNRSEGFTVMSGFYKKANVNSEYILVGPDEEDKAYLQKLEDL